MDFSNFTVETKKNPSQVVEQKTTSKTKSTKKRAQTTAINSSIRHDKRSFKPSADYSMYKKVYQTCSSCQDERLHIINARGDKIRCTDCSFTYSI